ncbi:MAG: tetraacyldisaccharide 4'-kinase [Gemmatimonadales bacterium]
MSAALSPHRVARWLWSSRAPFPRLVRAALVPPALVYRGVMAARAAAYRRGWLAVRTLPRPTVSVGNLAVGGSGKTPLAAWIAAQCARRGRRPGILLRGWGGDEHLVHERLVPEAVVVPDPDRVAGAARAVAAGADVLVLDDAYQRLDVARQLNIAAVSAEHERSVPWPLPAGPWREGWGALGRADLIVVTRKRASREEGAHLAARLRERWPGIPVAVAHLALEHLEELHTGRRHGLRTLAGKRVLVAAGIADPASLAVQVRASGATVQLVAYQDHHSYPERDVQRLVQAQADADYVVVTEKDAVKLRRRWPDGAREPLVASLGVRWEGNGEAVERALDALLASAPASGPQPKG